MLVGKLQEELNMLNKKRNYFLFDGAAGGAASGGEGGATSGNGGVATTGTSAAVAADDTKPDDLFDDGYDTGEEGTGDDDSHSESREETDPDTEFDELIKTKYKDVYDKRIKDSLKKRFKSSDEIKEKFSKTEMALTPLYDRYGVDSGDIDALVKAMNADDSLLEDKAAEEGLTLDQYRYKQQLEADNQKLTREQEKQRAIDDANALYDQWETESADLKEVYPDFDLKTEAQTNEEFMDYLQGGMSVRKAYEASHVQEILSGAIQAAVSETRKNTVNAIRARGMRPRENGMQAKASVKVKKSVDHLTDEDMQRINARVAKGEKVTL